MNNTAVGIIIALVPVLIGYGFSRRKTKAETTDLLTQAAERVTEMLRDQLEAAVRETTELREQLKIAQAALLESTRRISTLTVDIEHLTSQVKRLNLQIYSLGAEPDIGPADHS